MMNNNWFVISGGPGAGKTTTINLLKERGLQTTTEAARSYYEEQLALGITNEQIRANQQKLQDGIFKRLIDIEENLDPQETVFLDRALPDNLAYHQYYNLHTSPEQQRIFDECNYKTVFYLEQVPMVHDEVRKESDEEAQTLADLGIKVYESKHINIVHVPVMEKEKRVDYILDYIKNHQ